MKRGPKFCRDDLRTTQSVGGAASRGWWARLLEGEKRPHRKEPPFWSSHKIQKIWTHSNIYLCTLYYVNSFLLWYTYIISIKQISLISFDNRLGSDLHRPYKARLDRPQSIDEDEDGPRYPEDYCWKMSTSAVLERPFFEAEADNSSTNSSLQTPLPEIRQFDLILSTCSILVVWRHLLFT